MLGGLKNFKENGDLQASGTMAYFRTIIIVIAFFAMTCGNGMAQDNDSVGLTGTVRSSLIEEIVGGCLREQSRRQLAFTAAAISQYCRCYANGVADRLSVNELKRQRAMSLKEQDVAMEPIVQAAGRQCVSVLGLRPRQ